MTTSQIKFTLGLNDAGFAPAAKRAEKSLADIGKAGQVSAGQIAAATRGLPAQFTDIATQLAGGQNPFLVLLQQGGQIKDQFGGVGNAIKGMGAAISPVGLVVGTLALALGGMATAAVLGANEAAKLRDMMVLTGNAAGLTADRVDDLAKTISASSQQTVGEARDIVVALASTGQTSSRVLESQAKVIGRIADLSGKAGRDIAASFASQLDAPAKFAAKLNEAYNFLTVADFKRIQALERGKKSIEAANLTNDLLNKSLDGQRTQLGYAERAWDSLTKAISRVKQALLDVGKPETIRGAIDAQFTKAQELQKRLAETPENALVRTPNGVQSARAQIQREVASAQRRIFELQRQADIEATNALARSDAAADTRTKIDGLVGARPADPLGAIQTGREQYRADFLRSEKAFYAELEDQDKKLRELARQDPLGEFITERVLPDSAARAQQRLTQEAGILQSLVDENERAGAELLTNERERGRAIIEIDRQIGIRRLQQQDLSNDALLAGIVEVNTRADIALRSLNQQIVQKELDSVDNASQSMADSISTGILDGFRRGNSLADIFLQELKAQFAKTVLSPIIKPVVEAGNAGLQGLLQGIALQLSGNGLQVSTDGIAGLNPAAADFATGTVIRGRRAGGGRVEAHSSYLVGEQGPEVLRMGAQSGSVVPNHALGGVNLSPNLNIHIDARSDQAQVAQLVAAGVQQGMRATMEQLRVMGATA